MAQPGLNELLKWSVENSSTTANDPDNAPPTNRNLNPDALNALFGGPSDADLMIASMSAVLSTDPEVTVEDKLVAFDNFEQLIENLDNANNLGPLELWAPLLSCLDHAEGEIRKMAAWCVGTAVQNNEKSQKMLLERGGVVPLAKLACKEGEERLVRRKAIYALSSACRNYQPAMDVLTAELGKMGRIGESVDASDMDACDVVFEGLREEAAGTGVPVVHRPE
jgi:hsp70-interacting protein